MSELYWALSHVTGKAAVPNDIGYPMLRKLPLIGRLAILDTMRRVWQVLQWKEELVIPIPKEEQHELSTHSNMHLDATMVRRPSFLILIVFWRERRVRTCT